MHSRTRPVVAARAVDVAVGVTLVVYVWALVRPPVGALHHLLHDDGAMFVYLAVAARLLVAARRHPRVRESWSWLATAMMVFAVAMFAYLTESTALVYGHVVGLGDLVWLLAYTPAIIGLSGLMGVWAPAPGRSALLDSTLVAVGAFSVTLALISHLLQSASTDVDPLALAITVSTVYFDVMLASIVFSTVQRLQWRPPKSAWTLLAAAMVFAIGDTAYAVLVGTGTYESGGVLDLTWPLSAAGFAIAATTMVDVSPPSRRPDLEPAVMVPPLVLSVLAVLLLVVPVGGPLTPLVRVSALITAVLAVARLRLAATSAASVARELRVSRVDPLTGLPNRRGLLELTEAEVRGATLVSIDIDGLGDINRQFGLTVGDRVLLATCDRIRMEVRADDLVARTGDDEFSVLLRNTRADAAYRVARALVSALERELVIDDETLHVSACAGVSSTAHGGVGAHVLMADAESALHEAQRAGSGIVREYLGDTGERSQEQIRMRTRIKDLLRSGGHEFVPYFQPIVTVDGASVKAVESLVRWHQDGRVLTPGAFLAEVERSGSMPELTQHMLVTGLRQLRDAGLEFPMTLNVSADLVDAQLIDRIEDALHRTGSAPHHLLVEITEHAILRDGALARQVVGGLRARGVRVLLDDFGTGWSGLSSLRDLSVDGIKLDGSFITAMWSDPVSGAIVRGVAGVADELRIDVVYEGVEDEELLKDFASLGRGFLQGYAIARPMPIQDLAAWARRRALAPIGS